MAEPSRTPGPPRWLVRLSAPIALALSGRRGFPLWAIVHHHGRRSGAEYQTPIAVVPTVSREVFLIGLPWGAETNWAQNVLASGDATLTWKGHDLPAREPRLIGGAEAAELAKPLYRPVVRRLPAALVLRR